MTSYAGRRRREAQSAHATSTPVQRPCQENYRRSYAETADLTAAAANAALPHGRAPTLALAPRVIRILNQIAARIFIYENLNSACPSRKKVVSLKHPSSS